MNQPAGEIQKFILRNVGQHPRDITTLAAATFEVSRQAVLRHVDSLIEAGALRATGNTKARTYKLNVESHTHDYALTPKLEEHRVWEADVAPHLAGVQENVLNICNYGFTEICNNAIDHSDGKTLSITIARIAFSIEIQIADDGVGIFRKIREGLHLEDDRAAILELSKGKVTTDSRNHSGEGIFFSSRMFDRFRILSGHLAFLHDTGIADIGDWLIERREAKKVGTNVFLQIAADSPRTTKEIFDQYSSGENYSFSKTHVPISLAAHGDSNLVSRSQAKRVLARFEKFTEVFLDFHGVATIGQAFADEIFRVFRQKNPATKLLWINATDEVEKMIKRALAASDDAPSTTSPGP